MRERDLETLRSIVATRGGFGHREHLELAWNYLKSYEREAAHRAVSSAIRHLAASHGEPDKYHETITRFWMQVVALHWARSDAQSFEQFIAENPELLDGRLLERHYSRELIRSPVARERWTKPDLRPIPGAA